MTELAWWQKAVFYQIYPRSFADGNGDGIGDYLGMIERLDYLHDLGIDAVWISPHYPSPLVDVGYDTSDYRDVAEEYGGMPAFKRFLKGAHERGIRVILDWAINHTSDQHRWFQASRSSRANPKRDWYIWRDGKGSDPPSNWYSTFGGPAWDYDGATGQYYYHFFFREQPDLNWHNPQVRQAMADIARFWCDLGVDGFRLDAPGTLFEDPELTDHASAQTQAELYLALRNAQNEAERVDAETRMEELYELQVDRPEVHPVMRELRQVVDEYGDRVLVGEDSNISYYGDGQNELHLLFNFPLMRTDRLTPAWVRANQHERLSALPPRAWPCNTLGNHDVSRVYSHFADGQHDAELAQLSLALMLTLRGTPFLYYGEEIGMTDYLFADPRRFRDSLGKTLYHLEMELLGVSSDEAAAHAALVGRDKCRTPMQWSSAANGGFCPEQVQPWLPVNPNYALGVNVAHQVADPGSLLHFYRRLLRARKSTPALIGGDYEPVDAGAADYLAFLRHSEEQGKTCLVVLNWSDRTQHLGSDSLRMASPRARGSVATVGLAGCARSSSDGDSRQPGAEAGRAQLAFSSHRRNRDIEPLGELDIAPFEVYVGELVG
jgi:alpha-glucosidase